MRLKIIVVGKDRRDPIVLAAGEYLTRLKRYFPAELRELKEEPLKRRQDAPRVMKIEADRIRGALQPGDYLIALDERGSLFTSVEMADRMRKLQESARRNVVFVIGGPSGLDTDFAAGANERWSLSKLTLPHRLARLFLLEQLYRAGTILRGEPYHK